MSPRPWQQTHAVDPGRTYTALLGYLRLKNFAMLPRFTWHGMQIDAQLRRTTALVGFRFQAEFLAREFFHLSAWESEAAVHSFVHAQPHLRIMQQLVGRLGQTEFRYWSVKGSELPLRFERELQRIIAR